MSNQQNQENNLVFNLVVYDKEGNQVTSFSCDHVAKACALAIEQTKLHEGFVNVSKGKEFIWKYEFQEFSGLKVARYGKDDKKSFIITPPIKVKFAATAPLRSNGFNDFGYMYVKAKDSKELVENFIGDDDYYLDFPNGSRWLVYIKKYTTKAGEGFGLNF